MAKGSEIISPNLGLFLGREPLTIPGRGLQDGRNFRIKEGRISNRNLGWAPFSAINFGAPVTLIDTFFIRNSGQKQIIGTNIDLFEYDQNTDTALLLNARYNVGTVNVSNAANAVVTVNTGVPNWITNGIKPGDKIHFGNNAQRNHLAVWYNISAVNAEGQLTLTGAVAGSPLVNQAYTIRRTFTGGLDEPWDTETFVAPDDGVGDDLWFATNGADFVVTWDGIATQVVIRSSLGFTCRQVSVYKNMMLYGNIALTGGDFLPTTFINSDIGKPLDVVNGLAGQFRVHDGTDHIKVLEDLGDNMVFYSERTVTLMQFVGDPLIFVFREAASGVGPIASRLLADFGDYHEFIGADSQYLFDGVSVTEVGKQVWREILRLRDPARHELGFAHFDEENGDLIWAVALTSDAGVGDTNAAPEQAFVEHYLEEVGDRVPSPYSRRDFPFFAGGYGTVQGILTWDQLTEQWEDLAVRWNESFLFSAFPINLMGTASGQVMTINVLQTANGVLMPSYVRFGRRLLGDGRMRGLLTRVYPFVALSTGFLDVTCYRADHASGPAAPDAALEFDLTLLEGRHFVTPYRRSRYYELQFGTDGGPYDLSGYDVDARPGGRR